MLGIFHFFLGSHLRAGLTIGAVIILFTLDALRCERMREQGRAEVVELWKKANAKAQAKNEHVDTAVKKEAARQTERIIYLDRAIQKEVLDGSADIEAAKDEASADRAWRSAVLSLRDKAAGRGDDKQAAGDSDGRRDPMRAA